MSAIVAFKQPPSDDCDAELEALGVDVGRQFFNRVGRIVARRDDHWDLPLFTEFRDVPLYKLDFDDCFAIIAVEDDPDEGITVTLMLALRRVPARVAGKKWDGRDMSFIRDEVVLPRTKELFHG